MPFKPNEDPQFNSASSTCVVNTTHHAASSRFLRGSGEKGAAQSFSEKNFLKVIAKEDLLVEGEGEQIGFSVSHSKGMFRSPSVTLFLFGTVVVETVSCFRCDGGLNGDS